MLAYGLWAIAVIFVVAMYTNDPFRTRTNEIWDKYVLNALSLGWPYALYDTISSGALGRTIRAVATGY